MRTFRLFSVIGIVALGFAVRSSAQTTVVLPLPQPAAAVDIAEQPGCPIQIVVRTDKPSRLPSIRFDAQNKASQPIRGYVLVVERGPSKMTHTTIRAERTIEPGKSDAGGIGTGGEEQVSVAVDHVLFADGSTWGEDIYARSKLIADYLAARELAIERLRELIGAADPTDFLEELRRSGGYTIGLPANMVHSRVDIEQRKKGYDHVLETLRKMKNRTAEAQELARKLELMETPSN